MIVISMLYPTHLIRLSVMSNSLHLCVPFIAPEPGKGSKDQYQGHRATCAEMAQTWTKASETRFVIAEQVMWTDVEVHTGWLTWSQLS
jgi:hypothetical protein